MPVICTTPRFLDYLESPVHHPLLALVTMHTCSILACCDSRGSFTSTQAPGANDDSNLYAVKVFKKLGISDHKISLKFMDKIMDIISTF